MKLTTFILMIALAQVSAATFAQKLTYRKQGASLKEIFAEIKIQTGYNVLYSPDQVDPLKKINANFKETALNKVLEKLINAETQEYAIVDQNILIKEKEHSFLDNMIARFQEIEVRGKVVDETGKGLPGVTIRVKDGKGSAISGANGDFQLKNVDEGATIVFTYVGYDAKEIEAKEGLGAIKLNPATSKLDEIVVQAYGKTSQRLTTGNISGITSKEIEKQPVTNPLLTLQARIPGVTIEQQTGTANSSVKIKIQGPNSISSNSEPLYVIDGAPYTSSMLPYTLQGTSLGISGNGTNGNPLSFLNPNDIESISVLKDADATSIYGSRAASGAILITTKKGKSGQTVASFNIQNGYSQVGKFMDVLNTQQYLEMRREAIANDGRTISTSDYDLNGTWDQSRDVNWQKELIGGTAKYRDYSASVSGGTSTTQFLISGGYHNETTVIPIEKSNFGDTRGNVHLSLSHSSQNQKFDFQLSGSYMIDVNKLPDIGNFMTNAVQLAPNAPAIYNADGTINWALDANESATWQNPARALEIKSNGRTANLISNILASYRVFKGFKVQTTLNYNDLTQNQFEGIPSTYFDPLTRQFIKPYSTFMNGSIRSWMVEPKISYEVNNGRNQFNFIVGSSFQQSETQQQVIQASDFSTDIQLENIRAAASTNVVSTSYTIYKYIGVFGRVNYNFDNRYLLNLNWRRDGSSRFGNENLFNNFWSVSAGWIFSEERFFKDKLSFLSFGKIATSYGTQGNDQIGDYRFLSLYSFKRRNIPYQNTTGIGVDILSNSYLQWENNQKLNLSLSLGFVNDRILFTTNYFRNRSSNQLLNYALPSQTGFPDFLRNFPATLQNSGLEITLTTQNIKSKNFTYSTSFNITIPRNKLIAFEDLANSSYANSYIIGKPTNATRKYIFYGVNSSTGLYEVQDHNGAPTSNPIDFNTPEGARFTVVDINPQFYGGLNNSFSYNGFNLDFTIQFTKQLADFNMIGLSPGRFNFGNGNQPSLVMDRWQKPGDIKPIQKFSSTYPSTSVNPVSPAYNAANGSDVRWRDGAYARLKNLSLSWNLPSSLKQALHLRDSRVFIQGQNLWTVSNYEGLDPETQSFGVIPILRTYTLGIQFGL